MWGQNSLLYFFNWISVWAANHLSLHVMLVLTLFVNKPTEAIFFLFKKNGFLCVSHGILHHNSLPIQQLWELKPWRYLVEKHALFPNCLSPLVNSMPGDEPVMDRNHIHVKVENSLWTINAAETKISSPRRWNPAFKLGPKQTSSILLSPSQTRKWAMIIWGSCMGRLWFGSRTYSWNFCLQT